MADPYIGEIRLVPYNFAPTGWALCQGQIIAIAQNTALFSLLGTQYGGNGQTTFALPDLQGRVPLGTGQGPGLSDYTQGETGGIESLTLTLSQIPPHSHPVQVASGTATLQSPTGSHLAASTSATGNAYSPTPAGTMAPQALTSVGSSFPHPNLQPYLAMNYIIALTGVFPPRN